MRPNLKYILTLSIVLISLLSFSQEHYSNYYKSIKTHNLSNLWSAPKLYIVDGDVKSIPFPEPIGFIGSSYQRFYIHYTSILKDATNPYIYIIKGKTKVNNHVCSFTGTITVVKAEISSLLYYDKYKQGNIACKIDIKEDSTQSGSGYIKGMMMSYWYMDKAGKIHYDTIDSVADGFSNNECKAKWTSYKNHQSKQCNWGDFRIPDCGDLDIGAGEFSVNKKYLKNGWQSYMSQFTSDKALSKKSMRIEKLKWWQ